MSSTTAEVFVDANVFVYTYASGEPHRQQRARAVLDWLVAQGRGKISTQVLAETFRVIVTKLRPVRDARSAVDDLEALARTWPILLVTPFIVLEAARGVRDHKLNYWDAQLWATARLNQIPVILTEDFTDGRTIEGVRFLNPFADGFDVAALG